MHRPFKREPAGVHVHVAHTYLSKRWSFCSSLLVVQVSTRNIFYVHIYIQKLIYFETEGVINNNIY